MANGKKKKKKRRGGPLAFLYSFFFFCFVKKEIHCEPKTKNQNEARQNHLDWKYITYDFGDTFIINAIRQFFDFQPAILGGIAYDLEMPLSVSTSAI